MYYGVVGKGAYKKIGEQAPVEITVSQNLEEGLIAVKVGHIPLKMRRSFLQIII